MLAGDTVDKARSLAELELRTYGHGRGMDGKLNKACLNKLLIS